MGDRLTRGFLRGKGIEDETLVQEIIDAHMETVTPLKAYRGESERLTEELSRAQEQLKEANKKLESAGKDDYKEKYEALLTETKNKEIAEAKRTGLRGLVDKSGLNETGRELAYQYTDLSLVDLDDAGTVKNADAVVEAIRKQWRKFIATDTQTGADVKNPPVGAGGNVMSMDDIYKMENGRYKLTAAQRQTELAKLRESQTQKG